MISPSFSLSKAHTTYENRSATSRGNSRRSLLFAPACITGATTYTGTARKASNVPELSREAREGLARLGFVSWWGEPYTRYQIQSMMARSGWPWHEGWAEAENLGMRIRQVSLGKGVHRLSLSVAEGLLSEANWRNWTDVHPDNRREPSMAIGWNPNGGEWAIWSSGRVSFSHSEDRFYEMLQDEESDVDSEVPIGASLRGALEGLGMHAYEMRAMLKTGRCAFRVEGRYGEVLATLANVPQSPEGRDSVVPIWGDDTLRIREYPKFGLGQLGVDRGRTWVSALTKEALTPILALLLEWDADAQVTFDRDELTKTLDICR